MSKRILLIGGGGFLGSALELALRAESFDSLCSTSKSRNSSNKRQLRNLDVLDQKQVMKLVGEFEVVINLTGQASSPLSACLHQNIEGTLNIIEACKRHHTKLIHVSSILVHGATEYVNSKTALNPESPYATCKAAAELIIQSLLQPNQYAIVRLSNLYGAHQLKGLFWFLLKHAREDKPIHFSDNDGSLTRNFIHVDDAARIIAQLIVQDAEGVFSIASKENYSVREIVVMLERIMMKSLRVTYAEQQPLENTGIIDLTLLEKTTELYFTHNVESFLRSQLHSSS
ncbi:NAD(P)-dependent oxidoreductase [Candidatus Woesebacteria bacterium]|nr:NAD(P)-dependent oxidoreductase [Candidatus Woesebacteria bacterium]